MDPVDLTLHVEFHHSTWIGTGKQFSDLIYIYRGHLRNTNDAKNPLERERELSYKLLSDARTKKEGYDSQSIRRTFSSVDRSVISLASIIRNDG